MGRIAANLKGQVFGRLTVLKSVPEKATRTGMVWKCQCECGNVNYPFASALKSGKTLSCGCFAIEQTIKRSTKHNKSHSYLYKTWLRMKQRCYDTNVDSYKRYGKRGITVHKNWINNFNAFEAYVSKLDNCPKDKNSGFSIDRINNDGNYEPGNLKWSTKKKQTRNRRITLFLYINEKDVPLAKYAEIKNLDYAEAYKRYKHVAYTLNEGF